MRELMSACHVLGALFIAVPADPPKAFTPPKAITPPAVAPAPRPALRPGEITYADACAAVARGEIVTVFYRVPPRPVAGKWAVSDALPASGPGEYTAFLTPTGPKAQLIRPVPAARAAPAYSPEICVGGR